MYRALEIWGPNVTTMIVFHPFCEANRRSSRPSPLVVDGSGTKHCNVIPDGGFAQRFVSHRSALPFGFDTTTVDAQPSDASAIPKGYLASYSPPKMIIASACRNASVCGRT
jgi:hypothetical protein